MAKPSSRGNDDGAEKLASSSYQFNGVTLSMPMSPLTPEESAPAEPGITMGRGQSDADFEESALGSKRYFEELANRIQQGDITLTVMDAIFAAGAIRAYTSQITTKKPHGKGQDPKFDHGKAAFLFALRVGSKGISKFNAIQDLALEFGVSDTAIKKAITKNKQAVNDLIDDLRNHSD